MHLFEKQNPKIAVNVFGYEEKEVYPLSVTKNRGRQYTINLMLLVEGERYHYCLINTKKDCKTGKQYNGTSRLLSGLTKHNGATHYCPYCLHRFSSKNRSDVAKQYLVSHMQMCANHGVQNHGVAGS